MSYRTEAELDQILAPPRLLTLLFLGMIGLLPLIAVFNAAFLSLAGLGGGGWSAALGVQIYLLLLALVGLSHLGVTVFRTEGLIRSRLRALPRASLDSE